MNKRSSIFWGLVFIILASLLLLQQQNILKGNLWDIFWPAILILVGMWMVIGYFMRGRTLPAEQVTIALGSSRSIYLKLDHGAGKLNLHSGATTGNAISGTCNGGLDVKSETSGDRLDIKLRTPSQFWDWAPGAGLDWDLALTSETPLKLNIHSGASTSVFDLSDLIVTELKVDTGASSTVITMPKNAGNTIADIDTGVSSLKLTIPEGVAGRIRVKSGLSAVQVNTNRFPRSNGDVYQSADYATANNRADITIDAGVGAVEIN